MLRQMIRKSRLRWFELVKCKNDTARIKRCTIMAQWGYPTKTWWDGVKSYKRSFCLSPEDAQDWNMQSKKIKGLMANGLPGKGH